MIRIKVDNSIRFLSLLNSAIENGDIRTWSKDSDGDFIFNAEQWKYKAWMRHVDNIDPIESPFICFGIVGNNKIKMTKSLYSIYHCHFLEMLLTHFDIHIVSIEVSPLLDSNIDVWPHEIKE